MIQKINKYIPLEAVIWLIALVALTIANPVDGRHYTVCPLALAGVESCPGCGLGRSISALMHGEISLSLQLHWLGIPAFLVICSRIIILLRNFYKRTHGKSN